MSSVFKPIPEDFACLRKIPLYGSWAMLVGNSSAPRGQRLPQFCGRYGLRRMDIIYVFNEQMSASAIDQIVENLFIRHGLASARRKKESAEQRLGKLKHLENDFEKLVKKSAKEYFYSRAFPSPQENIYDANVSVGEVVRFWDCELSFLNEEKIRFYLKENAIKPVTINGITPENVPAIQNDIKELLGALELDGLSHNEALAEIIPLLQGQLKSDTEAKDLKKHFQIPNYYYKTVDEVYYTFNEGA